MDKRYILSIDQSTSGTKALLIDDSGAITARYDRPHQQIISREGWVSHDAEEIWGNVLLCVKGVVEAAGIDKESIAAVGISNQRETAMVWERKTGVPIGCAVVWQCGRGQEICARLQAHSEMIRQRTGLQLSPYFSAAKIAWLMEKTGNLQGKDLCAGTMDSWLLYKLTGNHYSEYANAARTQLFNIHDLCWDREICGLFGISSAMLPEVKDSNADFGSTTFDGYLDCPVPILGVLGDSNGALYGQGCIHAGMVKSTYGTGSSIMMNIGPAPVDSRHGLVTSIGYCLDGKVDYVLEGNINYSAAVIKWLAEDLGLIKSSREAGPVARTANPKDTTYLVPAFTGLGAPHWQSEARAVIMGMSRHTGRAEIVRAAEDSIAYQITDVVRAMEEDTGAAVQTLRVDGGATKDSYLMQFQSDLLNVPVSVPQAEELSALGPGYLAGIKCGLFTADVLNGMARSTYQPHMAEEERRNKYDGWKEAVRKAVG